jgi:hypothetical protein
MIQNLKGFKLVHHKCISMRILPIDIAIHLDTKHKVSEVWDFLLEDAFKGYFQPLYTRKINKPLPEEPIEHEKLSREYHASFLEKNLNFHLDQLPTTPKCICGAFKVSTNTNNSLHFIHFLLPEVKIKDGNLHLEWTKLDPALTLDVHRHEFSSTTTFYVSIAASHGLWGTRHQWLKGMLNILEIQKSDNELKESWLEDIYFLEELEGAYENMKKVELETLQLDFIRELIWDNARKLIKKFSSNEKAVYVTPTVKTKIRQPVDIQVLTLNKLPKHPLSIPEDIWTKLAWHETLSWYAPEPLKERTMSYWSKHPNEDEFLDMIRLQKLGWKGTWPAIVEIITRRPETPKMIGELVKWIADPNWPGAGEAMNHLYTVVGQRAIPIIDEYIEMAKNCGDDWWEEILEDLKEDIIDKNRN